MKLKIPLFFFLFIFITNLSFATKNITVGVYSDKPLIFKNKQNHADGFWIDLINYISKKENFKINFYYGEWDEIYELLKEGKIDLLPDIAITKERMKFFDFNKINVLTCWGEIVIHKDSKISTIFDLKDKSVACIPNDIHCIAFRNLMKKFNIKFKFVPVNKYIDTFKLISLKKVDAGAVNNVFFINNSKNFPVKESPIIYNPIDLRFATTKGDPKKILPILDRELSKLKSDKNSEYYHILRKWLKSETIYSPFNKKVIIILTAIILGLIFIVVILNWIIKLKTKELRESNETLNTLFNEISDAIFLHDINGQIIDVNESMLKMYKITKDKVLKMTVFDFTADEKDFEKAKQIWGKILNGEKLPSFEWKALRPITKEVFYVEVSLRKITLKGKDLILASVRDITNRKIYEQELLKLKKLESISFLAGGIAHDFNNLLMGIIGNISLAKIYLENNNIKKVNDFLNKLDNVCSKAKHLTTQLLTFAKGGEPIIEVSSIKDVITQTAEFILSGSKIKLILNFEDNLKNALIDKNQISQVIQNILINSKEAMPEGGIIEINCFNESLKEQIFNLKPGNYIKIEIKDNGKGIPDNIIDKIFDPFFTTKEKGNGLGLSICHSIIKKHNGHISVKSKEGEWTKFEIYLPATDLSEESKIYEKNLEMKDFHSKNILVIDDEDHIRSFFKEILELLNYKVFLAENSKKAIEIFIKNKIDIAFIDLTIPGDIGGEKILQKLKEINPEFKAVVMSGYSTDPVISNYKKYGFSAYLSKPFKTNELKKVLSKLNLNS